MTLHTTHSSPASSSKLAAPPPAAVPLQARIRLHPSSRTASTLRALLDEKGHELPSDLFEELWHAMEEYDRAEHGSKKLDKSSAQKSGLKAGQATSPEYVVPEESIPAAALISIARWAKKRAMLSGEALSVEHPLRLHVLLKGASLALPQKRPFVRSPELEATLARIKQAADEAEYARMISGPSSTNDDTGRTFKRSSNVTGAPKLSRAEEAMEWQEVKRGLSAVVNVVASAAAVALAAWKALGNGSVFAKTMTSLLLAIIVAVAETVLYARHFENIKQKRAAETKNRALPSRSARRDADRSRYGVDRRTGAALESRKRASSSKAER
ncbi:hypothetical protein IE81DRAFT_324296 [Ceraceosorus guamensis]|uniref:Endoplasmic reticulum-based factor for assembly of V-ATPase n=1 Tax=Ceraceosorus guamensis TaxID=1522189 RepID=A0A316VVZ9_9BASI|nr:hypothetical protein IE81DRAFT_324296 [Ceraceosorus guamensis]PWN41670.1 hypothetical protein IE81DRAFT_324296 [Ceraceosorus guamensis]